MKLSKYIDHTILNPDARSNDIKRVCKEAIEHDFATVCLNTCWVKYGAELLKGSGINVSAVVGVPFGAMSTPTKAFEAKLGIEDGATEVDMMMNVGQLLDENYEYVKNDIKKVKEAIGKNTLKVILETCLLNNEQIKKASQICVEAGADFVKTSTGFSKHGATTEAVEIMINEVKGKAKVKAAGGIRTPQDFEDFIKQGVTRIGTSSGIALISGEKANTDY